MWKETETVKEVWFKTVLDLAKKQEDMHTELQKSVKYKQTLLYFFKNWQRKMKTIT